MPANTPRGLPYPLPTEPVAEGAQAIRNLAEAIKGWQCLGEIDAAAAGGLSFTGIDQDFDSLRLIASLRATQAGQAVVINMRLNNVATAQYVKNNVLATNSLLSVAYAGPATELDIGSVPGAGATAGYFASVDLVIPAFTASKMRTVQGTVNNPCPPGAFTAAAMLNYVIQGVYADMAPITALNVFPTGGGPFASGSRAWLYGISGV